MMLSSIIYTFVVCSSCAFLFRFAPLKQKLIVFIICAILCNLPLIYHLSLVEWIDSVLGQPSMFLFLLSLSACFVIFYAPREVLLSTQSKAFIVVLGFVVFLGNLNLLWGFDLFSLNFEAQLLVVLGILFFALSIDLFLGVLYLLCLVFYVFFPKDNLFFDLIDIGVWLYSLMCLIIETFGRKRALRA